MRSVGFDFIGGWNQEKQILNTVTIKCNIKFINWSRDISCNINILIFARVHQRHLPSCPCSYYSICCQPQKRIRGDSHVLGQIWPGVGVIYDYSEVHYVLPKYALNEMRKSFRMLCYKKIMFPLFRYYFSST